MCKVKELRRCDHRVVINTKEGKTYYSEWKIGAESEATKANIEDIVAHMQEQIDIDANGIRYWSVNHARDDEDVLVTDHAIRRIRERNGWNKKTTLRMMQRIYDEGLRPEQTKGNTRRFLMNKQEYNPKCEYVLYGEYIYVFINKICVTAFTIARVIKGLPKNSRYNCAA